MEVGAAILEVRGVGRPLPPYTEMFGFDLGLLHVPRVEADASRAALARATHRQGAPTGAGQDRALCWVIGGVGTAFLIKCDQPLCVFARVLAVDPRTHSN